MAFGFFFRTWRLSNFTVHRHADLSSYAVYEFTLPMGARGDRVEVHGECAMMRREPIPGRAVAANAHFAHNVPSMYLCHFFSVTVMGYEQVRTLAKDQLHPRMGIFPTEQRHKPA